MPFLLEEKFFNMLFSPAVPLSSTGQAVVFSRKLGLASKSARHKDDRFLPFEIAFLCLSR